MSPLFGRNNVPYFEKYVQYINMNNNRVGIRLRHLEQNYGDPNKMNQPTIPQYQETKQKQVKKYGAAERSISPRSRRKIFQMRDHSPSNTTTNNISKQTLNNNSYLQEEQWKGPMNMMKKLSNNSEVDRAEQLQKLIVSLKQKSLELEKKDEIIKRLRKQIENLNIENRQYRKQIASLREEFGQQINSLHKANPPSTYDHPLYKQSLYEHSPYEELQPQNIHNPIISHKSIDYSSNVSNNTDSCQVIVSPLMALNSQDSSKPESFSKSSVSSYNSITNNQMHPHHSVNPPVKFNKMKDSVSSTQSNGFRQFNNNPQPPFQEVPQEKPKKQPFALENPFKKQNNIRRQSLDRGSFEKIQPIKPKQQRKNEDCSFQKEDYFPFMGNSAKSSKVPQFQQLSKHQQQMQQFNPRKPPLTSLSIEDSKQFQFEDFSCGDHDQSEMIF